MMKRVVKALLICGLVLSTIGWLTYNRASQSAEFSPAEIAGFASISENPAGYSPVAVDFPCWLPRRAVPFWA